MKESETYILLRVFLELFYSFSKQYISFYEREVKNKILEKGV